MTRPKERLSAAVAVEFASLISDTSRTLVAVTEEITVLVNDISLEKDADPAAWADKVAKRFRILSSDAVAALVARNALLIKRENVAVDVDVAALVR